MKRIVFNIPPYLPECESFVRNAMQNGKISGDGEFTKKCNAWFENLTGTKKALLTTSCTHATEMAAILSDIQPGDEVIMPSFTFVSTANAFVLRGAIPVFVDIRPDTMNIDEELIEDAITEKTKAIVPVHYAGVACEMDTIMDIAARHHLQVIEDAAQGVMSTYKGKYLGAIGDYGCYSFHETKNYSMGEGGAILIKHSENVERAEIIREKGTNRSKFYRGEIDKYTWVDAGSSYLPSELNAAYLYAQLENEKVIFESRMSRWNQYYNTLKPLAEAGYIDLPVIPEGCRHNAHMFYIKAKDLEERTALISYLKSNGVGAVFHYIPLHSAPAGLHFGRFHGEDVYTTKESERLIRLPMYFGLTEEDCKYVCDCIGSFYRKNSNVNVRIRPITMDDTKKILEWRNNPRVMERFIHREPLTEEVHKNWLETQVMTGKVVQFIVETEDQHLPIGSAYLQGIDREVNKKAEFGMFIGEEINCNKGYGTAVAKLVLQYAFDVLKLNKVFMRALSDNERSMRFCEKAGFKVEGVSRDDVFITDSDKQKCGFRDVIFMSITKADWEKTV